MTLRELEQAATPAPWKQEDRKNVVTFAGKDWAFLTGPARDENAAFIAALRNKASLLLDVVDAARGLSTGDAMDWTTVSARQAWNRLRKALAALDAAT